MQPKPIFIVCFVVAILFLASLPAWGQATAIVRGTVLDPTEAAIPDARVELFNPLHSQHHMVTQTGPDGSFILYRVPFNPYRLTVEAPGFQTHRQTVDVHTTTLTVEVVLQVGAMQQQVEVTAPLLEETAVSTHLSMDSHELERMTGASSSRLIESALLQSAGIVQNANGRMYVRGAHYQISFMIDGLPVSDQLSIDFANPFDVRNVEALEIYTSNFPAEFGNKVSAVVNVSTKSGIGSSDLFHGSVGGSLGSFDTGDGSVQVGGGTTGWGYFLSVAGGQTHRNLDSPGLDNLHNGGNNQSVFARLDFAPTQNDFVNFYVSGARSRYDVPNLPSPRQVVGCQIGVEFGVSRVVEAGVGDAEGQPFADAEVIQKLASIRDISASGVYFTVDREVRPESKIEFYVQLQMEGAEKGGVLLHCVGSILRVEPDQDEPQRQGVAARIDRYRFLRPGESPLEAVKEEERS